jgi:hypothetical protein
MDPQFAPLITRRDGHFLAGFLEGEACLRVVEQNGGQSFSCAMTLNARDDDAELLEWVRAITGIGRLRRVPARSTSRAQVIWKVDSQEDCSRLAELLAAFPFRGRRRQQLSLWSEAVAVWTRESGTARAQRLVELRAALAEGKRYVSDVRRRPLPPDEWKTALAYLAGFITAEGCFQIYQRRPRLSVHLRADDRPLLEMLADVTGWGRVADHSPSGLNPSSTWTIGRRFDVEDVVSCLRRVPLGGRKLADFRIWSEAVDEIGSRRRPDVLDDMAAQLRAGRAYVPSPMRPLASGDVDPRHAVLRALREAASGRDRLSCTAYAAARREHPHWPHRNTIARVFGSWAAAMEAAGLGDRVARRDVRPKDRTRAEERLRDTRRAVLAALERCAAEFGRAPAAMEFFRWRLANAPGSPTQATVYRAFPGGWKSVLAASRCESVP